MRAFRHSEELFAQCRHYTDELRIQFSLTETSTTSGCERGATPLPRSIQKYDQVWTVWAREVILVLDQVGDRVQCQRHPNKVDSNAVHANSANHSFLDTQLPKISPIVQEADSDQHRQPLWSIYCHLYPNQWATLVISVNLALRRIYSNSSVPKLSNWIIHPLLANSMGVESHGKMHFCPKS